MTIPHALTRYPTAYGISSILDPLDDVMVLVQSLTSAEYLVDVISAAHALSSAEARRRAKHIVPHIKAALAYIDQAHAGPRDVAFLPLYYAFLNFSKVYILLRPRHADLAANRWHGAQYAGHAKNSQTLLTEEVVLRKGGALPLLYETLTGHRITRDVTIRMADVYPYVSGIGAEFNLATGRWTRLARVTFDFEKTRSGRQRPIVQVHPFPTVSMRRQDLKLIASGFRKHVVFANSFIGAPVSMANVNFSSLRNHFRTYLLYGSSEPYFTPLCGRSLLLPEELPTLLLFFHLGSVARYKPEFLEKLRDSRFWPMLLATQRHSLFNFLSMFWSFVHQQTLVMQHSV